MDDAGIFLSQPLQGIVRLMALSGQRREEVAAMRWSELDLDAATWTIGAERYKTQTDHVVPLVPAMLDIIRAQPRNGEFVFTFDGRHAANMSQELGRLRELTPDIHVDPEDGLYRLHDLRRTFRTGLARLKVPREIADLIDHPKTGVSGTYDRHLYIDEKRQALETWARHVAQIVETIPCTAN
jgi:integrase